MHTTFLSVILQSGSGADRSALRSGLPVLFRWLTDSFSDFEIVIVQNGSDDRLTEDLMALCAEIRPHIHLIRLSSRVDVNNAWLAGLDRANGDYNLLLQSSAIERIDLLEQLYEATQSGSDIAYLRAPRREGASLGWLYRLFYWIMRRYSDLEVDPLAHHTRIFSRRALNALLQMRENLRYFKAVFSLVGYRSAAVDSDLPLVNQQNFNERFRTSLLALTSYTSFLRVLMGWLFVGSFIFLLVVSSNALLVRFAGHDVFGTPHEAVSGWTYLVVLIAVFFAVTCLNLYLMSIYLSHIYQEIKQRPPYIIESIKRF